MNQSVLLFMVLLEILSFALILAFSLALYGDPLDFEKTWPIWVAGLLSAGLAQGYVISRNKNRH